MYIHVDLLNGGVAAVNVSDIQAYHTINDGKDSRVVLNNGRCWLFSGTAQENIILTSLRKKGEYEPEYRHS